LLINVIDEESQALAGVVNSTRVCFLLSCFIVFTQVVIFMSLSIVAAVSAAVQLGMGATAAVADHAMFKDLNTDLYVPYHYVNHYNSSSAWSYFTYYGCSDLQREKYLTVRCVSTAQHWPTEGCLH
jgi:hypothetical protein